MSPCHLSSGGLSGEVRRAHASCRREEELEEGGRERERLRVVMAAVEGQASLRDETSVR